MRRVLLLLRPLVLPALLIGIFEVYARKAGLYSDAIAPPSQAVLAFWRALRDGSLWQATAFTLSAAGMGLALGAGLGLLCGTVLGLSARAARIGFLSVEVLRPVPSIALVPLAMLVFGFGLRMEVSVVAFATFWPILILAQSAARQVDPRLLEVAQALQLSWTARLVKIVLPAMVPRLFVALRLGVAIALVVAVTVEIAANPHGMGYAIMIAQQSMEPALMLAWLFWIGMVGVLVNALAQKLQTTLARHMGASA